jgi:hypothetical protein
MKKYITIILYLGLFSFAFGQQQILTSISAASLSNQYPFSVGDIYIEGSSGFLGSYAFLSNYKVDVKDLNEKDQFYVVPNPMDNTFQIKVNGKSKIISLTIINESGQTMAHSIQSELTDISHFLPGIYFVKINDSNIIKFIKY